MYLRTLGELALEGHVLRRRKPLLVLAYLAIEGPKSRRQLAELFWMHAQDPRDSLSTTVRRLNEGGRSALVARGDRLEANVACDAAAFMRAAQQDPPERVVELYTGAFLDGLSLPLQEEIEEWVYLTRERLAKYARRAHLALARAAIEAGRNGEASRHAESALDVLHASWTAEELEEAWRLLNECRNPRAGEVERVAPQWGVVLGAHGAGEPGVRARPSSLPHVSSSFVGRAEHVQRIRGLLERPHLRLLTLHGPGGTGKSRLATESARMLVEDGWFPDGAFFVGLEAVDDPEAVPSAIAATMGIVLAPGTAPDEQIIGRIGSRHTLLVLDNYEHLVGRSAIPARIVRNCANVRVLVTSRNPLNFEEEHVLPVDGLPVGAGPGGAGPEGDAAKFEAGAAHLLDERIRQRDPHYAYGRGDAAAVQHICELVDGNPLAIELAAAHTRVLSLQEIAEELGTGLDLLVSRDPTASARHQSMHAALDVSWRLLSPREQQGLAGLAAFHGGFSRHAARAVVGLDRDTLARLVDGAMVRTLPSGRFERHPLVYQFTAVKLAEQAETERAVFSRHARYFLQGLAAREHDLHGGDTSASVLAWIDAEFANVHHAWSWAVGEGEADLLHDATWALAHYAEMRGRYADVIPMLERAMRSIEMVADESIDEALGGVLGCLAFLQFRVGRIEEAIATGHRCVELLEPILRPSGNWGWWSAREALGLSYVFLSDHERAKFHLRTAFEGADRDRSNAGDDVRLARIADFSAGASSDGLAYVAIREGRFEDALDRIHEGMRRLEPHRAPALGYSYWTLGQVHLAMGNVAAAHEWLDKGLHFSRATGFHAHVGQVLNDLVRVYLGLGEPGRAEATCREALDIAERTGDKWLETTLLAAYGLCAAAANRTDEARSRYLTCLRTARSFKGYGFAMEAVRGLADVWAADGKLSESVVLFAFLRGSPSAPTAVSQEAEQRLAQLQEELDARCFADARRRGESLRPEEAFSLPEREVLGDGLGSVG